MVHRHKSSVAKRLKLYWSMVRYAAAHNRDFAREHYAFFAEMIETLRPRIGQLKGLRVLDVGCGKSMWLTLLLHSYGCQVTGIDTEVVDSRGGWTKYRNLARGNGWERALRTLAWDTLYARPYYRALQRVCPFPLNFAGLDARAMSVTELDFADQTFDLVVSHEVFEHLTDLETTMRSLRRVMKPSATTYIYTHNYASISGGHHIAWKYPDKEPSSVVPPWDHLRQNRFPDIPSWINRLRERDYRQTFERHFEIVDWFSTAREGESLLTAEIRNELSEYSEEELLTKGFVSILRPLTTELPQPSATSREAA